MEVEGEEEAEAEAEGEGEGELQRDERLHSTPAVVPGGAWSAGRTRHFFNATSGHLLDRGSLGSLP
jgi:hypothetical protein